MFQAFEEEIKNSRKMREKTKTKHNKKKQEEINKSLFKKSQNNHTDL